MFFSGSYVALITPWTDDGTRVDYNILKDLIEWHIASGTDCIVPAGTTGESATLTHTEQGELIAKTVEYVNKRCLVMAGAGSNSTSESVSLAKYAKTAGADAILVITPYYNRPTPEGLYRHFMSIADKCNLPMMLYNVPGRTGTNMMPETVARLAKNCPTIKGIKDASGVIDQASATMDLCDISIMSGDDSLTLPLMSIGACGVVSVIANIMPKEVKDMVTAALAGDFVKARKIHYQLFNLVRTMFIETNPIPVKTALKLMNKLNGTLRLPLVEPKPETSQIILTALQRAGLVT